MKVLVDLKSIENIDKYQTDGFIASSKEYSCHNDRCYTYDELSIISEFTKKNNKLFIVNIDRIVEEEELDLVKAYIDKLLELNVDYFIYGDFSILMYFKEKNLTYKLIYDPKTMITNYHEACFHKQFNSLVSINNELTLEEIKDVIKAKNTIMEVYGFHQMFYSRRQLLSNYSKFKNKELDIVEKELSIVEEKRDNEYPIYESSNGTFIYTPYIYCLFKELVELGDLKFIRINSIFLNEEKVLKVLELYNALLNDFSKADNLYKELELLDNRISSGFLYKKSILLKEVTND